MDLPAEAIWAQNRIYQSLGFMEFDASRTVSKANFFALKFCFEFFF